MAKKSKKIFLGVNAAMARKVLEVVDAGLVNGLGNPKPGEMCVEAAVAYAYGEDHNDNPKCVHPSLASMKIELNDSGNWLNNADRAKGLRRLAIAQLGSKGNFDVERFWELMNGDERLPVGDALACLNALAKEVEKARKTVAEAKTVFSINEAFSRLLMLADRDFQEPEFHTEIDHFMWEADSHHTLAEQMVQCLIKMKVPGTKYLYLTEKKAAKKAKKPVKKAKAKKNKAKSKK